MNQCKDCKKKLDSKNSKYCQSCFLKNHNPTTNIKTHKKTCKCSICKLIRGEMKGKNHPKFKTGKPHCIDCRKKLSNYDNKRCIECSIIARTSVKKYSICINCGKQIGWGSMRCRECYIKSIRNILRNKNNKCIKCKKSISDRGKRCHTCASQGDLNGNFIHGEGNFPYPLEFSNILKESIRKRDNYICQYCEKSQKEELKDLNKKLSIHHIDYNKFNNKINNLITLCERCNVGANSNINYWYSYFTYLMENYYV